MFFSFQALFYIHAVCQVNKMFLLGKMWSDVINEKRINKNLHKDNVITIHIFKIMSKVYSSNSSMFNILYSKLYNIKIQS